MKKNIILLVCVFNVDISLSTEIAPSTPIPSIVTDGSMFGTIFLSHDSILQKKMVPNIQQT